MRQPIEEKGLALDVDVAEGLPAVQGDRERIAQVLTNLWISIGELLSLGDILLDCGYQFIRVEGFEEEGQPSSLQSGLLFTMPGGDEDHWNGGSDRVGLEATTGFDAPYARHPHVHDNQSRLVGDG